MSFKCLIMLGALFLISCGGGSSSTGGVSGGGASAASTNSGQITDQLQIVE